MELWHCKAYASEKRKRKMQLTGEEDPGVAKGHNSNGAWRPAFLLACQNINTTGLAVKWAANVSSNPLPIDLS